MSKVIWQRRTSPSPESWERDIALLTVVLWCHNSKLRSKRHVTFTWKQTFSWSAAICWARPRQPDEEFNSVWIWTFSPTSCTRTYSHRTSFFELQARQNFIHITFQKMVFHRRYSHWLNTLLVLLFNTFSRTTWVRRHQKGRTILDFNKAKRWWGGSGISWTILVCNSIEHSYWEKLKLLVVTQFQSVVLSLGVNLKTTNSKLLFIIYKFCHQTTGLLADFKHMDYIKLTVNKSCKMC